MTTVNLKSISRVVLIGFVAFAVLTAQSYAQDTAPASSAAEAAARKAARKKNRKPKDSVDKPAPSTGKSGAWESFPDGSSGRTEPFHGGDGTEISAYIRKPKGEGPFPVVVLLHVGGTSHPKTDFVNAGWAVYSVHFRPNSNLLPVEWQDTIAAIDKAKKFPFVDSSRVALMGASHGGHIMTRVAARTDASCVVLAAPAMLNLLDIAADAEKAKAENDHLRKILKITVGLLESEFKAPIEVIVKNPKKYDYESPFVEMEKIRMPVLILCGQNDDNYRTVQAYTKKLQEIGKTVETYFPENGPHGFYIAHPMIPETEEAAARAVAFIRKNFGKNAEGVGGAEMKE